MIALKQRYASWGTCSELTLDAEYAEYAAEIQKLKPV